MQMLWLDPFRTLRMQVYVASLAMEASAVIWMRMLGFSGVWSVSPSESTRMVTEKQMAFARGGQAALRAAMGGKSAEIIVLEGLAPARRTARANQMRLTRSGPRKPKR